MAIEDEMKDVQQLVVNQLGVANGLNNSLADGQVTPAKMSTGAPTWDTDGRLLIHGRQVEINPNLVGDDDASIDFHSTSASEPNYDARIHKRPGENSNFQLENKGTGHTVIYQNTVGKFITQGGEEGYTTIAGGGMSATAGAKITLNGSNKATNANNIDYTANKHIFKNAAGGASPSYVQMNMTDAGLAELVVASEDSSGEANVKIESYTPSLILSDKSTGAKDFQIQADGGKLRIQSGDTSGDAQLTNTLLTIEDTGKIRVGGENPQGVTPFVYIHGTRDEASQVDRLELQGDEVAIMSGSSGSNYATEALKVAGSNVYVPNGNLLVGKEGSSAAGSGIVLQNSSNNGGRIYFTRLDNTGTQYTVSFYTAAGAGVGGITTSGTSASFNTSSDYRLKTDAQPMTGATARLKALNPVNFEWIADGTRVDGFLAHEAQEVVPEAVHGTKDALDEEGNPDYQGIDQSKLVPLLTAALQEALTKMEALEVRITNLEA
tara:strand:+ start:1747 stop:3225 length:1479 start_codon:yes stop_codon:yes gene_type:complete